MNVIDDIRSRFASGNSIPVERAHITATEFAAMAELVEAARLANGDHTAPHDCYATGPMTGDSYLDFVRCPGCQLAAALTRFEVQP